MGGFLSLLIPAIALLVAFAWGILLGLKRVRIRFITVAVCLILAMIAAFLAKDLRYSDIAVWIDYMAANASGTELEFWRLLQGAEPLQNALSACGGAIIAPAVFLAVFVSLSVVSGMITYLVFLITAIVHLASGRAKRKRAPFRILAYTFVQVLLTVFVIMTPVVCYLNCLPPVVDAVASLGALPENSEYVEDFDVAEARQMIESVNKAPLTVVYRALGGNAFCRSLTTFRVSGEKTTLPDEVDAIGRFVADVGALTEAELADFNEQQTQALRHMVDCFGDSKLLPAVAGELVYGTTDAWLDEDGNGRFLGLECPDIEQGGPAIFTDLFEHILEIFHTDARNPDVLCANLDTLADILDVMVRDGVLANLGSDPDAVTQQLTKGSTVAALIAEMEKNKNFEPLIDDITTIGMRAIGSTLQASTMDPEAFGRYTGEIADTLNNIRGGTATEDEQKAALTEAMRRAYSANTSEELPLDDSVLELYADVLLGSFEDDDTVTSDDVAALFEAYAN